MGSLMAGWASPVLDPNKVRSERNRSLTNEEIEAFWRTHQEDGRQKKDLDHTNGFTRSQDEAGQHEELEEGLKRSLWNQPRESGATSTTIEVEKVPNKSGDWWIRSNWAFLNEPLEDHDLSSNKNKYAAQFHVAGVATQKAT